jgi:ferredoxin
MEASNVRVTIDADKCIASGSCVLAAPEVFSQDDDGIVVVLQEAPPTHLQDQARQAMRACPAAVIWLEDS